MFHNDLSWTEVPALATMLLPVRLPAAPDGVGIGTEFIDMRRATEEMPRSMRELAHGSCQIALHNYGPPLLNEWMHRHAGCTAMPPEPLWAKAMNLDPGQYAKLLEFL